jgi:hypothetical protein
MHQYEQQKHEARFVHVGKYVLVLLNLTGRDVMFDSQHMIEPQTDVLVTWTNVKQQKKDMSALAFVAEDYLQNLSGADLVMITKDKGLEYFGDIAVPLSKLSAARKFDVNLQITPNDATYNRMINAIHSVWDPETGRKDLWTLLLNHQPKLLPQESIFTRAKVPEKESEAALKEISNLSLSGTALNESQLSVINGIKSLSGDVQLIQASDGTGKTTTIALLTQVFRQTSLCTLLCAPTNTAVDEMCVRYSQLFLASFMSLRVYASDRDRENTLLYSNRSEEKESDESSFSKDILLLEVIRFMTKTRKTQKRRLLSSDLLSRCIELVYTNDIFIMRRYVDGTDDDNQSKYVDSVLDMFKELRAFLEKAKNSSEKSFFE